MISLAQHQLSLKVERLQMLSDKAVVSANLEMPGACGDSRADPSAGAATCLLSKPRLFYMLTLQRSGKLLVHPLNTLKPAPRVVHKLG